MERETLLNELNELGYQLVPIKQESNVNKILAEVIKSKEPRLWQGFPIIFANSLKSSNFSYRKILLNLNTEEDIKNLQILMNMSLALYKYFEINVANSDDLYKTRYFDRALHNKCISDFKQGGRMHILSNFLSPDGIIKVFRNYARHKDINIKVQDSIKIKDYINMREEFDLDFALSQLFSRKQKELFLKKLRGEKMTKTEREYFSRSVRRKILAVANPDLHRLAVNLLKD